MALLMSPRLEVGVVATIDTARGLTTHLEHAFAGIDSGCNGVGRGESQGDIPTYGAVCRQTHDDHLVGVRGEDLAAELVVVALILHGGHRTLQVEVATVALRLTAPVVVDVPIAQGLVALMQTARPLLEQLGRLEVFAALEQRDHFGVGRGDVQVAPTALGVTAVEGVLVELQQLVIGRAEDHRTQATVAHRQRLVPVRGRLLVPQLQVARLHALVRSCCGRAREKGHCKNEKFRYFHLDLVFGRVKIYCKIRKKIGIPLRFVPKSTYLC